MKCKFEAPYRSLGVSFKECNTHRPYNRERMRVAITLWHTFEEDTHCRIAKCLEPSYRIKSISAQR